MVPMLDAVPVVAVRVPGVPSEDGNVGWLLHGGCVMYIQKSWSPHFDGMPIRWSVGLKDVAPFITADGDMVADADAAITHAHGDAP
jgi:hypothetical protein